MKKPKPITQPIVVEITPRLLSAVEGSIGRRLSPGCIIMVVPPLPPPDEIRMTKQDLEKMAREAPQPPHMKPMPAKHPGQTCHICKAKDYACEHIPGVPF